MGRGRRLGPGWRQRIPHGDHRQLCRGRDFPQETAHGVQPGAYGVDGDDELRARAADLSAPVFDVLVIVNVDPVRITRTLLREVVGHGAKKAGPPPA